MRSNLGRREFLAAGLGFGPGAVLAYAQENAQVLKGLLLAYWQYSEKLGGNECGVVLNRPRVNRIQGRKTSTLTSK
jgi:hypothetical protein